MSEEEWPIGTPRDEVLARVVTRGNRIVAVRRAFSVAMLASVVGVSALGASTVISNLGSKGTETEQIAALLPQQPESSADGASSSYAATSAMDGSTSTSTSVTGAVTSPGTGTGSTTVSSPAATAPSVTATGSVPTSRPRSTTSRPPAARPTNPSTTAKPPVTTPVASPDLAAKPLVGTLRTKADGVPMGDNVCENEPESRVLLNVDDATKVQLSLNHGKETRTVTMTLKAGEWSAEIGPIAADPNAPSLPVLVTVVATGPGGVTTSSAAIKVVDCTP